MLTLNLLSWSEIIGALVVIVGAIVGAVRFATKPLRDQELKTATLEITTEDHHERLCLLEEGLYKRPERDRLLIFGMQVIVDQLVKEEPAEEVKELQQDLKMFLKNQI